MKKHQWIIALVALAAVWLFPHSICLGGFSWFLVIPLAVSFVFAGLWFYRQPAGIVIWGPILLFGSMFLIWVVVALFQGASTFFGPATQNAAGGILMLLGALCHGRDRAHWPVHNTLLFLGLWSVPRVFLGRLPSLPCLNTFAVILTMDHQFQAVDEQRARQVAIVHLRDLNGRLLANSIVGATTFTAEEGGHYEVEAKKTISDIGGVVRFPFQPRISKLVIDVAENGYDNLQVTLYNDPPKSNDTALGHLVFDNGPNQGQTVALSNKYPLI